MGRLTVGGHPPLYASRYTNIHPVRQRIRPTDDAEMSSVPPETFVVVLAGRLPGVADSQGHGLGQDEIVFLVAWCRDRGV